MSERRTPRLRVVGNDAPVAAPSRTQQEASPPHEKAPRPADPAKRGVMWSSWAIRLMATGWAGVVLAALFDAYGAPHLPAIAAIGMTGLFVATIFLVTRDGVPDWRGDVVTAHGPHDDVAANDLLTNLPTFNHFSRRLGDEFARTRRMGKHVSVVLIDVNNLTAVNKEYGVRAGDEVLRHVARCADETRRYSDIVSRLGDDEFGVLLMDCGEEGVRAFMDRLEERLSRESASVDLNGRQISLWAGVCSGAATSDAAMQQADDLLAAAIANLNGAKEDRERRRRMWLSA